MKKTIIITSLFILQLNIYAQLRFVSASDSIAIDQQLDSHFGMNYKIDDLIFVDSLETNYDMNRSGIDDKYGILDDCIVFTASRYENYRSVSRIIGVYRDDQIIWYSYNIDDEDILGGGFIDKIKNINDDGKVEIMTIWLSEGGASYHTKTLYVHSWDGNQGNVAVYSPYGSSPIGCNEFDSFYYIDVNGDGKWEIISFPSVFEWDGSNYVYSETMQLDSISMFFPRNNFIPIVQAWVDKVNDKYIYNYKVENSSQSAQSINQFDVYGFDVDNRDTNNYYYNVLIPNDRWYGDDRKNSVTWDGYPIRPGNSLSV